MSSDQEVIGACYICLDESQTDSPFVTPNPCKCRGTIRIHDTCLTQVMHYRRYCGICKTIYARFINGFAQMKERKMLGIGYELLIEYTIDTNWKKQGVEKQYRKRVQYFNADGQLVNSEPVLVKTIPYKNGVIHGTVEQLDIINPIIPREDATIRQKIPYIDGKIDGLRSIVYNDTIAIIPYVNGVEHGNARYSFMNGRLAQSVNYVNGLIVGEVKSYYEDGAQRSIKNFNEYGKLHGNEKYWLQNGILQSETNYLNGKRDGLMTEYYSNGQVKIETNFRSGIKDGLCCKYNMSGTKIEEINYTLGLINGIYKSWYDNGVPMCEVEYIDGLRFGYSKTWHENGIQSSEVEYINDRRYGLYTQWDFNGGLLVESTYDEDPYREENEDLFETDSEEEEEEDEEEDTEEEEENQ